MACSFKLCHGTLTSFCRQLVHEYTMVSLDLFTLFTLICNFIGSDLPNSVYVIFDSPAGDKSIEFLQMIFGNLGSVLKDPGTRLTPLVGSLFSIFNTAVLSLGSIVLSYTIILSTLNTAQEGEIMGRKFSSLWIPARCTLGITCLLSGSGGYSLIQVLMMKFILLGVGAANHMWAAALNAIEPPTTIHKKIDQDDLKQISLKLFEGMLCAHTFNNDPVCRASVNHQIVSLYHRDNKLHIGIANDPQHYNLCGTFTPGSPPPYIDRDAWYTTNISALQAGAFSCQAAVEEIYRSDNASYWTNRGITMTIADTLRDTLLSLPVVKKSDSKSVNSNLEFGWLLAGSFYFEFTNNKERNLHFEVPSANLTLPDSIGEGAVTQLNGYKTRMHNFFKEEEWRWSDVPSFVYNSLFTTSVFQTIWDTISNKITATTNQILLVFSKSHEIYHSPLALTDGDNDPISNLRDWGNLITGTTESLFSTVTFIAFGLIGLSCAGGFQLFGSSVCTMTTAVVSFILPLFYILLGILWAAGITLSLYVPLIPYLVFTFTALGWFILVIEAMVAAPIVALGLVSPSAEVLGKASPAVMIIASVFLRPSLMIIGFILSITLVKASITMINLGFQAALQAFLPLPASLSVVSMANLATDMPLGGLGLFKNIIVICLYAGFVIMIIHECFSLIYVLPDKVIRWIGHSAEQSGQSVKASVQEIRETTEKGGETAGGLMKGISSHVQEKLQEKIVECRTITNEIQQGNAGNH